MDMERRREIQRLFSGSLYAKLFAAVRRRLEEAGNGSARSVTLASLDDGERATLADLFALKRRPGIRLHVRLDRLEEALRNTCAGAGLVEVLEALGGPLVDRRARRHAKQDAIDAMWVRAADHPTVVTRPVLKEWLEEVRRFGLLRRAGGTTATESELLETALEVVSRLPASGTPLSVLAAESTGDSHALDVGSPLAGLVIRAAAQLAARTVSPATAIERRQLWDEMGVVCDPLSPHTLVLGLRPSGEGYLERHLREAAAAGEPVKLTLRQHSRTPLTVPAGTIVYVCENPTVIAVAADRLGSRSPALVCTEGVPSTAALRLLEGLRESGALIRFHGDFDWGGIRIMNDIHTRFGGQPWHFSAQDYRTAIGRRMGGLTLSPKAIQALWDADLESAMQEEGRAVFEEQLVDDLITDLEGMPV